MTDHATSAYRRCGVRRTRAAQPACPRSGARNPRQAGLALAFDTCPLLGADMTGSRQPGKLEGILLVINASIVILGLAYLLLDPHSFIRRPIGDSLQRRRVTRALHAAWPDVASQGMWFNPPSEASGLDTVVIFSDYECPYCRQLHPTLAALQEQHSLPAVRYRSLPLAIHLHARFAARVSICADEQGSFLGVHRYLMERTSWQETDPDSLPPVLPVKDVQALRSCLRSSRPDSLIAQDSVLAATLFLTATPSIVSRSRILAGAVPAETFLAVTRRQ